MATLKIADSPHKDALLADKEFFAQMHSARIMQLTQNFVTRLSESSSLSMKLLKQDGQGDNKDCIYSDDADS